MEMYLVELLWKRNKRPFKPRRILHHAWSDKRRAVAKAKRGWAAPARVLTITAPDEGEE